MYLEEFKKQIQSRNFNKFLQLWEEYSSSDEVEVEEFQQLLELIKTSDFSKQFGKIVESALPLWQTIKDADHSYKILQLLIDIENTNTPALAELAFQAIKQRHGQDPQFNERLRLVGLRTQENFQGAISNYELLAHFAPGKFVYHPTGWGAGEIIEVSPVRQQVTIEFENVPGRKHLTFESAFKSIVPLPDTHFLSRRFSDPDKLEAEARKDPVAIVKMLLRDLGPKTAAEIKDELCELVIPEKDWSKWWQGVRTRLKKDPLIETPESLSTPFRLRKTEITHEERLTKAIKSMGDVEQIIANTYSFVRDLPDLNKHQEVKQKLQDQLTAQLQSPLTPVQELQIIICLEDQFDYKQPGRSAQDLVKNLPSIVSVIDAIDIIALKKKALNLVREHRKDWKEIFFQLFHSISHSILRDYLLKELNQKESLAELKSFFASILEHPENSPDCFLWFFQRLLDAEDNSIPFANKEGRQAFFEGFLILMNKLESQPDYKDTVKKMYNLLAGKRYALVRRIFESATVDFVKEILLLASKCHTLSDHDRSILQSLAGVVFPQLSDNKNKKAALNMNIVWTTEEAYLKMQDKVRHLGTVEIVENAREIEAARALGDLRENSEYKFARERRARLLGQLKLLSDQLQHARIITPNDITTDEVGVGCVVEIEDAQGKKITYTILGPWEADADRNILSSQSKLAQAMMGNKHGDIITFKDDELKVLNIKSYLDK